MEPNVSADNVPFVDEDALEELTEQLDKEEVLEIVSICIEEISELLPELVIAVNENDLTKALAVSHKVKGCASGIGAAHLATEMSNIEQSTVLTADIKSNVDTYNDLLEKSQSAIYAVIEKIAS